jgi:AraC-like DNA-binding protein
MDGLARTGWVSATSLSTFEVAERRLILPDTALDLAWVNGRIDVIGPMSVARPSRYPVGTRVMLLSLSPAHAAIWLGVPLSELTDIVVDLRDICTERAQWLEARFEVGTIGDLVRDSAPAKSRAGTAARALARGATVAEVAEAVNLSERQLTRSFRDTMGLHPKRFQRIARLRRAVVAAKGGMSLAGAAIEGGYADQAHFTREITAMLGAPPREILPNVGNVQDMASCIG